MGAKREGLDFFPLSVKWDTQLKRFFLDTGLSGIGAYVCILREIYACGYALAYDSAVLAHDLMVSEDILAGMLDNLFTHGLLDKALYEQYNVLTSRGIQLRWMHASTRRSIKTIAPEYCLLTDAELKGDA
jgi:hypothetical protein